jgi:hypothetical protein
MLQPNRWASWPTSMPLRQGGVAGHIEHTMRPPLPIVGLRDRETAVDTGVKLPKTAV